MITINTKQASVAIGNVMRAVPKRSMVPMDQCIKLSVRDGVLMMMSFGASDGLSMSDGLEIVGGVDIPPAAVDAQRLNQVMRTAIGDTIQLKIVKDRLFFKSGTMSARFSTQDPEMFLSEIEPLDLLLEMELGDFRSVTRSLMFLCDRIEYPGNYSGAFNIGKYFLSTNNAFAVGRSFVSDDMEGSYWVPAYSMNHVARSASSKVSIYLTHYGIKFVSNYLNVDVSLVDSAGQDFSRAFARLPGLSMATVDRKRLSDLLSAAAIFAKDFSQYVSVTLSNNQLDLLVGKDVFSASVEAEYADDLMFGVNCHVLNSIVSNIPGDDVHIGCVDGRMIYITSGKTEYALSGMSLR